MKEQVSTAAGQIPAAGAETPDDARKPDAPYPGSEVPQPPIREGRDCV